MADILAPLSTHKSQTKQPDETSDDNVSSSLIVVPCLAAIAKLCDEVVGMQDGVDEVSSEDESKQPQDQNIRRNVRKRVLAEPEIRGILTQVLPGASLTTIANACRHIRHSSLIYSLQPGILGNSVAFASASCLLVSLAAACLGSSFKARLSVAFDVWVKCETISLTAKEEKSKTCATLDLVFDYNLSDFLNRLLIVFFEGPHLLKTGGFDKFLHMDASSIQNCVSNVYRYRLRGKSGPKSGSTTTQLFETLSRKSATTKTPTTKTAAVSTAAMSKTSTTAAAATPMSTIAVMSATTTTAISASASATIPSLTSQTITAATAARTTTTTSSLATTKTTTSSTADDLKTALMNWAVDSLLVRSWNEAVIVCIDRLNENSTETWKMNVPSSLTLLVPHAEYQLVVPTNMRMSFKVRWHMHGTFVVKSCTPQHWTCLKPVVHGPCFLRFEWQPMMHEAIMRARATVSNLKGGKVITRLSFVVRVTTGPTTVPAASLDWWHASDSLSNEINEPVNLLSREKDHVAAEQARVHLQFPREFN